MNVPGAEAPDTSYSYLLSLNFSLYAANTSRGREGAKNTSRGYYTDKRAEYGFSFHMHEAPRRL
jgi:hypothetical protein